MRRCALGFATVRLHFLQFQIVATSPFGMAVGLRAPFSLPGWICLCFRCGFARHVDRNDPSKDTLQAHLICVFSMCQLKVSGDCVDMTRLHTRDHVRADASYRVPIMVLNEICLLGLFILSGQVLSALLLLSISPDARKRLLHALQFLQRQFPAWHGDGPYSVELRLPIMQFQM